MVSEHRVPRRPREAGSVEGRGRLREQPGVRRRVHVRPVVERVRVAGPLHPVVARPAAVRLNRPAADHRERPPELVQLCVVDQVATLDHRVGCERVDPLARDRREFRHRWQRHAALLGASDDRLADGMLRALLGGGGEREHVVFGDTGRRDHVGDRGAADRERRATCSEAWSRSSRPRGSTARWLPGRRSCSRRARAAPSSI